MLDYFRSAPGGEDKSDAWDRLRYVRGRLDNATSPDAVAIRSAKLRVKYTNADGEPVVELEADNGQWFTNGELLYKIHNSVAADLSEVDRHYFEGLARWPMKRQSWPPGYWLRLGS